MVSSLSKQESALSFRSTSSHTMNLNHVKVELKNVNDWCKANKLTINVEKTNYMVIKTPQRKITLKSNLCIGSNKIINVFSVGYLVVNLDQSFSCQSPNTRVVRIIIPKFVIISKIRHFVRKSVLINIYNAFILPHLTYCLEIWGNTDISYLERIFRLQKTSSFDNYFRFLCSF